MTSDLYLEYKREARQKLMQNAWTQLAEVDSILVFNITHNQSVDCFILARFRNISIGIPGSIRGGDAFIEMLDRSNHSKQFLRS